MEQSNFYDPASNLECNYRFTCAALKCPGIGAVPQMPPCHVDKFKRYQPDFEAWHRKDWEDVKRITWHQVFSLKEAWVYILYIIIILVFLFMVMVLIKLLLKI